MLCWNHRLNKNIRFSQDQAATLINYLRGAKAAAREISGVWRFPASKSPTSSLSLCQGATFRSDPGTVSSWPGIPSWTITKPLEPELESLWRAHYKTAVSHHLVRVIVAELNGLGSVWSGNCSLIAWILTAWMARHSVDILSTSNAP